MAQQGEYCWSEAELDRDCPPSELVDQWYDNPYEDEHEHDWGLEGKGMTRWDGSWHATNKASLWWQQKKEQEDASFARHGELHPALGWNFWTAGYKHIVYKSPRCNQINRDDDLRWDKQGLTSFVPAKAKTGKAGRGDRGDRYAVLNDGDEVYMIVATAASYKKRGNDPYNYKDFLFIRPDSLRS